MSEQRVVAVRRIVTGHEAGGVSTVLTDGVAENVKRPTSGIASTLMWCTDRMPADIPIGRAVDDMGARILGTPPPANGTRFCIVELAPGARSPLHRTESIDYVIVLDGEIHMELDASSIRLIRGDVVIQRGSNHSWVNLGTETARFAVVLVDAQPLGIGHPVARGINTQ